jgi:hypothetical protein
LDIDDWRACPAIDLNPAEDFVDVFGCGLFLAGHTPIPFDTSEIERNARDFFG